MTTTTSSHRRRRWSCSWSAVRAWRTRRWCAVGAAWRGEWTGRWCAWGVCRMPRGENGKKGIYFLFGITYHHLYCLPSFWQRKTPRGRYGESDGPDTALLRNLGSESRTYLSLPLESAHGHEMMRARRAGTGGELEGEWGGDVFWRHGWGDNGHAILVLIPRKPRGFPFLILTS